MDSNSTKTSYFREPTKSRPLTKVTHALFDVVGMYGCTCSFYRNTSEPDLKRVMIPLKGKYGSFGEKTAFSSGAGPGFGGRGRWMDSNKYSKDKIF